METLDNGKRPLRIYFFSLFVLVFAATLLLIKKGYNDSFLYLNSFHNNFFDAIVPHMTQLGDSLILSSILIILLIRKHQAVAITAVISILASGLIVILLKQLVFYDWHRPLTVLKVNAEIHSISGYVEYYRSFPSGHSTSISSAIPFLAILQRRKEAFMPILLGITTALLCYTRIYLGSHFLGDVLGGIVLGSSSAVFCFFVVHPRLVRFLSSKEAKYRQLITRILLTIAIFGLVVGLTSRYFI